MELRHADALLPWDEGMTRRPCEVCGGAPVHRLGCTGLAMSLMVVAIGVATGTVLTAIVGNRTGAIRLGIAELLILAFLGLNVVVRSRRRE